MNPLRKRYCHLSQLCAYQLRTTTRDFRHDVHRQFTVNFTQLHLWVIVDEGQQVEVSLPGELPWLFSRLAHWIIARPLGRLLKLQLKFQQQQFVFRLHYVLTSSHQNCR